MSLETRLRNTGQQGGGGGGSSDSAGLAGTGATYILSSLAVQFPNALYIRPGSSVTTHITGSNLFINAVTSASVNSGGLAGTGGFYVVTTAQALLQNSRQLLAGSSVIVRTDATNVYIDALTNSGAGGGTGYFSMLPQQAKLYSNTSSARIDAGTPIWRLIYSQATQQYGIWQFLIPPDYSSNPYVRVLWGVDSGMAVVRSTTWTIEQWGWSPFLANSSMYVDTYGAPNTFTMGISAGYSSGTLQMLTIPIANAVSLGLYNLIRIRISNTGNWAGNVEYVGGNFEYTRG